MAKSENRNQFSFGNFINFMNDHFALIIIVLIVLILGFLGGSLWTENQMLKSDGVAGVRDQVQEGEAIEEFDDSLALENISDISDDDHVLGAKKADVMMITYINYQCGYCQAWHPTFLSLVEKYGDQITFSYRQLTSSTNNLATLSECVAEYGGEEAYWKYTNTIFEKLTDQSIYTMEGANPTITDDTILTIAANAGASLGEVQACLESGEKSTVIEKVKEEANNSGITGTPLTVIISKKGGRELIPGALPIEEVEAMLEKHL